MQKMGEKKKKRKREKIEKIREILLGAFLKKKKQVFPI